MSESWPPSWPAGLVREQQAKAICARCVVVDVCAAHAVAAPEWYGVWGGLPEADRQRIWQHMDQADPGWRYWRALGAWDTTSASAVRGASGAR